MEERYYIAVPNKVDRFSYQTIFTWTNYSFTGTYDNAMITAIKLFEEHGHFDNIIDKLIDYYEKNKNISDKESDEESDVESDLKWYDWDTWDAEEKWENCREYFIDLFNLENSDEIISGVGLWHLYSNDFKKNWNEDGNRLHFIEIE